MVLCFLRKSWEELYASLLLAQSLGTKQVSFWKEELQVVLLVDFQCSQVHLEFDPQIPLPPFEFLNLETQLEKLHLSLKALVFYEK